MAKTVLIVEDNELNMKLFRDLLEAHGYQTVGTSNGYEALDLVRSLRPDASTLAMRPLRDYGLWVSGPPEKETIIAQPMHLNAHGPSTGI